jgi:selenide,water dikinase
VLLAGGGHAQLFVLEALARSPRPDLDVTLVAPSAVQVYSGGVPGWLAEALPLEAVSFRLDRIAQRAGVTFVEQAVESADADARSVRLADGRTLPFDVLSLATGSVPTGLDLPGVRAHALPVRPVAALPMLATRVDALAAVPDAPVVVVGGGAAGFEVATSLRERLVRRGWHGVLHLVDAAPALLLARGARTSALARATLDRLGIRVHASARVMSVTADAVQLASGALPSALTIWVTGAQAAPWLAGTGLACDAGGSVLVRDTLQSISHPHVLAAGDVAAVQGRADVAKAGVYAVRAGPILAANVIALARGQAPAARWTPQRQFLALLETGDGRAILSWRGLAHASRAALRLKRHIDLGYMARFQRLEHD